MRLSPSQDAQGQQIFDYHRGKGEGLEIVERDHGFINAYEGGSMYLSQYRNWPPHQQAAIAFAKGQCSTLDVVVEDILYTYKRRVWKSVE